MTVDYRTACPFIVAPSARGGPSGGDLAELRKQLETGDEETRIGAMQEAIRLLASTGTGVANGGGGSGSSPSSLLMTIIRFVLPNQKCKLLKKLVLLFFELAPKTDAQGRLLSEMILLCNALRNDLQHPNEYVRGVTLRFLTRIGEAEILEPLIPSLRSCLEHRHPYVRRNALIALGAIYSRMGHDFLVPDAPEVVEKLLSTETDAASQRNAFRVLAQCDSSAAWSWIQRTLLDDGNASLDRLPSLDGSLQLAIIDFVLTHHHVQAQSGVDDLLVAAKRIIAHLLQASRNAVVRFEAARALMLLSLSGAVSPSVVKAVAAVFIELASREADNNAKLMILERYGQLQAAHPAIVNEEILEVLRILTNASDVAIRQKVLALVSAGVTGRQAAELLGMLVKELTDGAGLNGSSEYRLSILSAMDAIASRFSAVAPVALQAFTTLLTDGNMGSAGGAEQLAVVKFIKEHLARTPTLIPEALPALLDAVPCLSQGRPLAGLLWILGDLGGGSAGAAASAHGGAGSIPGFPNCREAILARLPAWTGPLPWRRTQGSAGDDAGNDREAPSMLPSLPMAGTTRKKLNSDGTYATESALTSDGGNGQGRRDHHQPVLRELIVDGGNALVATALAMMLCKLQRPGSHPKEQGMFMLIITSSLKTLPRLDRDTFDRLLMALRLVSGQMTHASSADTIDLERECHRAFAAYLAEVDRARLATRTLSGAAQADERIEFRLAGTKDGHTMIRHPSGAASTTAALPRAEDDIALATDGSSSSSSFPHSSSTGAPLANVLATVVQLTGFSDEIYAETYVTISHADIILDILLVNQGDRMLQGVTIELATEGDLQVTEKPASLLLPPQGFAVTKASLKVRSTNSALIYGCISYAASATDCRSIILTAIPMDVSEYIRAAPLSDAAFRALWPTLEWENKIVIPAIHGLTLSTLMSQLLARAHLECCTPDYGVNETGDYLAANLHAVSSFGEEILANICLEAAGEAGISGHLRLRSKLQGIAVALGDHITAIVTKLAGATGEGEDGGK